MRITSLPDELCYEVQPEKLKEVCLALRDSPELKFEILIDVAGIDYLDYGTTEWKTYSATTSGFSRGVNRGAARAPHDGARFAVAYHLLSITHNHRAAPAFALRGCRRSHHRFGGRHLARRQLVRARGVRPVRHPVHGPPGSAPHPHRLRIHRSSVPQGFPADRQRRSPLRRRQAARGVRAGVASSRARWFRK